MEKGFLEFPFPKHLHVTTKQKKYLSIDLGLDNLVSAVSSESDTFLISFKLKDKIFNTIQKRKLLVKDYLHKVSCQIVQYCTKHKINKIVTRHNKSWKSEINIGRKNNQKYVQIPHSKLIEYINFP